jgi:phosphoribosylanthranilate isomerase
MTWVKICGITNLEDAKMAVEAGADALGFVFYPKSARNVALESVREITRHLPAEIEKLGVFVGSFPENLLDWMGRSGLTGLQLHLAAGIDWTSREARRIPPAVQTYLSMPKAGRRASSLDPGIGQRFPWRPGGRMAAERSFSTPEPSNNQAGPARSSIGGAPSPWSSK